VWRTSPFGLMYAAPSHLYRVCRTSPTGRLKFSMVIPRAPARPREADIADGRDGARKPCTRGTARRNSEARTVAKQRGGNAVMVSESLVECWGACWIQQGVNWMCGVSLGDTPSTAEKEGRGPRGKSYMIQ
jgi:hypothetical protein